MVAPRAVYRLAVADFLERVRRYSFLLVVVFTVCAGYTFLPPLGASYTALVMGGCRGFYSSPWVGTVFGIVVSVLLSFLGFYLVRGSLERDYQTRVGQILAATPLDRLSYVLGKWLSNVAVLALVLAVMSILAPIMQLVRAEDTHLDLWALWAPIWFMGLPIVAVVAACAVLFESITLLRRGLINVLFFFLWLAASLLWVGRPFLDIESLAPGNDPAGLSRSMVSMRDEMKSQGLDPSAGTTDIYEPTHGRIVTRFRWEGTHWTTRAISERAGWLGLAVVIALISALPFDRFDPARRRLRLGRRDRKHRAARSPVPEFEFAEVSPRPVAKRMADVRPIPLSDGDLSGGFLASLLAEMRLLAQMQRPWWYLILAGLNVAMVLDPSEGRARLWFAFAWLWPTLIWSSMGVREKLHQMQPIINSIAYPIRRHLPAVWMSGVAVAVVAGLGYAVRLAAHGQADHVAGWLAGALFVASLALALGVLTNSNRPFEMIYMIWSYFAFSGSLTVLDFKGTTDAAIAFGMPFYYFIGSGVLLVVAVLGKRHQMPLGRA